MDLFAQQNTVNEVRTDVFHLHGFVCTETLQAGIRAVIDRAPFRRMRTAAGHRLQIAMTNCGVCGWVSDHRGYAYRRCDPQSGQRWPSMPDGFSALARAAAALCGFDGFAPQVCLINHYRPGQRLSAHRDLDEGDQCWPIVSVSMGMSAVFRMWGNSRAAAAADLHLHDGDVLVWGRSARGMYHAVQPLRSAPHPRLGAHRFNLTFRHVNSAQIRD